MSEKLQKVLARAGQKSRRDIEALIKQGRVNFNGKIAMLGDRIDLTFTTKISIDGRMISLKPVDDELCRMLV